MAQQTTFQCWVDFKVLFADGCSKRNMICSITKGDTYEKKIRHTLADNSRGTDVLMYNCTEEHADTGDCPDSRAQGSLLRMKRQ